MNSFKKSIRTKLIEILETGNSYVDIDTLMYKMKDQLLTVIMFSL